ncbi:MAG: bifunctional UDP-sugar hydrolase/5'-nucleotidase [Candidatus Cloacimonetes bacterium]|jgi:2',3'-cyclic-nucleotide 2'-phosphodiesterase (5'-nucleotidase family)|nr:bifunctional metallophosphatase/5'-nucleotidase [Candidatus Cloacimonadota bacterium]MDD2505731.1 bifunctional UDP-sugar hydrolase/5'-nucleotidase [Candidatus Cloacimonadota bacterium]MDD4559153.1 bifunctional UDP-sugar hydrolase/5'-nucleotidase [Candidatus Cloacimonadota bacterium]
MKYSLYFCLFLFLLLTACAQNLRILHTNDSHAAYEPARNGQGGYLALEYHLDEARKGHKNTLWLDAGDMQTGSIFSSMEYDALKGGAVLEVFERLDLDAATFGNHEFDVSEVHSRALVERSKFPFLSANLLNADGSSFGHAPYQVFHKGHTRIAVIGLTIDSLPERVKPENVANLNILPYKEAIDRVLDEADAKSDLLVLLSHNGWEADSLLATQLDERVDMIIGGHSHLAFEPAQVVNGIYIVSTGSHLQSLGQVDLKLRQDRITHFSNRLIPLSQPPADYQSDLASFLEESVGEMERKLSKTVGILPEPFISDKFSVTPSIMWVAQSLVKEYPETELAMVNNGGFRRNLPQGEITLRDLHECIPFGNTIVFFSCYGRDILTAQTKNLQILETKPYDIMTVSEASWLQDSTTDFRIDNKPLELDRVYRIVSHDYILSQWDKYLGFKPFDVVEQGDLFLDAVINQVQQQFAPPQTKE